MDNDNRITLGLDPTRSVVVEACAGSGKTWLLVSRLVRLLLSGARPGQILAITYTRKAAREIEERLRHFLADLAMAPPEKALKFLRERGLTEQEAQEALPRARSLLETVLHAEPPMTISTFHGWFAKLLAGAPLESGLAGLTLEESVSALHDEAWAQLAARCAREVEKQRQSTQEDTELAPCAQSLLWLYENLGEHSTRKLLGQFIDRRAEWQAWCAVWGDTDLAIAQTLRQVSELSEEEIYAQFFSAIRCTVLDEYANGLKQNGKRGADNAVPVLLALDLLNNPEHDKAQAFELIKTGLMTGKNEPRAFTAVKAMPAGLAETVSRLHYELAADITQVLDQLNDVKNAQLNYHALTVGVALLGHFQRIKRSRRVMDFADLECEVDRLLADEQCAAFIQARLDARYKHILLDEFQDTNPLQWRILLAWLNAYHLDGDIGVQKPTVFLVGDPKQSIYRFRRADPRLFDAACQYFEANYEAVKLTTDVTRRNAPSIVSLVNEVFTREETFTEFRVQETLSQAPAHIAVFPRVEKSDADKPLIQTQRNPLLEAREEAQDERHSEEAQSVVDSILSMAGRWQIMDKHTGKARAVSYGDILILMGRKRHLGDFESALRQANIPFISPGRGGLLATLEAKDVIALLRFLADPADNLALAHVLRTPAFDVSDQMLLELTARRAAHLWIALAHAAKDNPNEYGWMYALLKDWVQASRYLPAHDVLDRVFHTAQWMERYQARVPEQMWPGVLANLEAMLELTLSVDGGRYPSLSRLVDELEWLKQAGQNDDAPDEGLIQSSQEATGRVRIMTIHGSKGLEAPVVWIVDADSGGVRHDGYEVVLDWPANSREPVHFSLLGRYSERGASRERIFEEEDRAQRREYANLLYVAITRAEQVLMTSAVQGKKNAIPSHYERLAQALDALGESAQSALPQQAPELDLVAPTQIEPVSEKPAPRLLNIGQLRGAANESEGIIFGNALHAWLEAITQSLPTPALPAQLMEPVAAAAQKIVSKPELRRFFDPALYVQAGNETALMGADGELGRIDRWVDLGDELWILDYKSGGVTDAPMAQYQAQLGSYAQTLRMIWPKKAIRAMLIFTEQQGQCVEVAVG